MLPWQQSLQVTRDPMNFSAADIALVISNKADVQGLRRAENECIATKVGLLPWQQSPTSIY